MLDILTYRIQSRHPFWFSLSFPFNSVFFSIWKYFVFAVGDSFDDFRRFDTKLFYFCVYCCEKFFNSFDDFWQYTIQYSTQQCFTYVYWTAIFYPGFSKFTSCLFVHEASWVYSSKLLSSDQFHSILQFKWYSDNQHSFRTARLTREKHAHTRLFVLRWKFQTMSKFSINVLLSLSFTRG